MRTGWIKIHRRMLDWEWYQDANTVRMFLHILLKANHKASGGLKRGSFATSLDILAKELGMSLRAVRTSLNHLVSTQEITVNSSFKGTIIQVNNYSKYQTSVAKSNTFVTKSTRQTTSKTTSKTTNQKSLQSIENIEGNESPLTKSTHQTTHQTTSETTTNKNIKNIKNINNKSFMSKNRFHNLEEREDDLDDFTFKKSLELLKG